jgi:hypothetical protein
MLHSLKIARSVGNSMGELEGRWVLGRERRDWFELVWKEVREVI